MLLADLGFVGLIVPHIMRLMLYNNILVLPLCTLLGGFFLLFVMKLSF
nr:iron chelate uptake ABC transporter family permease subunit [Campylobacter sp. MIT 97-5078]